MFTLHQLAEQIRDCVHGHLSVAEFEGWFAVESKGFRRWGDAEVFAAIDAIEDIFSQYHFEDLSDELALQKLGALIGPFWQRFNIHWSDDSDGETTYNPIALLGASELPAFVLGSASQTLERSVHA